MKKTTLRHTTLTVLGGIVLALAANQVNAGARDPRVNARQHHQQNRIHQGVRSGELTRHEARGLAGQQRDVRQLERGYKSDGRLTGTERRDLAHEQNQASRKIFQQKHDAQERSTGTAATRDPGVNARQAEQSARIAQGVKSGALTHRESRELRTERRDIRDLEQGYKSDGALSRDERRDLHQQLNQQSREIAEEKHDTEHR
jgi:hypothetical protein